MTLEELKKEIADNFFCIDGPSRAYFELLQADPNLMHYRGVYQCLRWIAVGPLSEMEEKLVDAAREIFSRSRRVLGEDDDRPFLIWRRHLAFEDQPALPAGTSFDTGQWEAASPQKTALTCRVFIPGVDLARYLPPDKDCGYISV